MNGSWKTSTTVLQPVSFDENKVLASLPPVSFNSCILPIGQEYFRKMRQVAGEPVIEGDTDDEETEELDDSCIEIPTNITPFNLEQFTYYEILGLSSLGDSADRDLIRKAYRKAVLLYHPDKMHSKGHTEEECRAIFLRVQAAADTLTDTAKRRAYDSLLDFDESIPTELEAKEASKAGIEAFLQLFEPVFKRNARFALKKPVPGIGSGNTPLKHVNAFYNYWINFDSWRDFTNVEREHDPDQAQSRDEKRWMQKENEKAAKKLKKQEMSRLNDLVTRALNHDPRIIADKERVKNEKAAQREETQRKKLEEQKAKEEKIRQEEEEKLNKAKEEKMQNEKMRKQASKSRNIFRKLLRVFAAKGLGDVGGEFGIVSADDCDFICQSTETAILSELNEKIGGDAALADNNSLKVGAIEEVLTHLSALKEQHEAKKQEELAQNEIRKREFEKNAIASSLKKKGVNREWSGAEFSMLSKAIKKFPAGTRQRWLTICNFMNDMLKPNEPYEKEECLQASQNAMKIMANLQDTPPQKSTSSVTPPALVVKPSQTAQTSATSNSLPLTDKISTEKPIKSKEEDSLLWSQEQQRLLEEALKKYPASMDKNERWIAIADHIPGKTKKECILRFKKLREELQAAKKK